mmetsp:Transcript_48312/g.156938  ORF Transcript_48312/g.156938 Transcript_48312/m.156938 type:complete len:217 (+) Transcript_48312:976-1626(+)
MHICTSVSRPPTTIGYANGIALSRREVLAAPSAAPRTGEGEPVTWGEAVRSPPADAAAGTAAIDGAETSAAHPALGRTASQAAAAVAGAAAALAGEAAAAAAAEEGRGTAAAAAAMAAAEGAEAEGAAAESAVAAGAEAGVAESAMAVAAGQRPLSSVEGEHAAGSPRHEHAPPSPNASTAAGVAALSGWMSARCAASCRTTSTASAVTERTRTRR